MSTTPIVDYALLSDRHSAALVSRDGSIDWQCFPRFDSPSIFGRLLGEEAGYWSIRPVDVTQITRRYLDRTMVLETTFRTSTGTAAISDALAMGSGNRGHELGRGAPHLLLRRVTCLEGDVDVSLDYVPRPEYGLVHPLLQTVWGGVTASGGSDLLVLSSPVALAVDPERSVVSGQLQLRRGESASFALHHSKQSDSEAARVWSQIEIGTRFDDTVSAWESWSDLHQAYEGPWRDLVHHSGHRCPRVSAAPETGTTAMPGSGMRPLPSRPSGSQLARTKPMSSLTT